MNVHNLVVVGSGSGTFTGSFIGDGSALNALNYCELAVPGVDGDILINDNGIIGATDTFEATDLDVTNLCSSNANLTGSFTGSFIGDGSQLEGITSSPWTGSGGNIYFDQGNIGIGNTGSATFDLSVEGGIETNIINATTVCSDSIKSQISGSTIALTAGNDLFIGGIALVTGQYEDVIFSNCCNIGINTTTPDEKLTVNGGNIKTNCNAIILGAGSIGTGSAGGEKLSVSGSILMINNSKLKVTRVDDGFSHEIFGMDGNDDITINRSSLVHGRDSGVIVGVGSGCVFDIRDSNNNTEFRYDENLNNFGIGVTPNVNTKVIIKSGSLLAGQGSTIRTLQLINETSNADSLIFDLVRDVSGSGWSNAYHKIGRLVDSSEMGNIKFGRNNSDLITFSEGSTEYMRIGGDGNLGIGLTNPSYKLQVSGTIAPDGTGVHNLGDASNRWNTVYTSDLSLSNEYGDWTIVEGSDDLFLYNNKRDKVYKFKLEEVNKNEAPPKKS